MDVLVRGRRRCTLQMNSTDAAHRGLADGDDARVTTTTGTVVAPVELTTALRAGVVSLPHEWGHDRAGTGQAVAARTPGVNSNVLTPSHLFDPLSGTSVLNGIPVEVEPVTAI
ncbi:MAG: molybdopterin dinucleotide binding domain-containing protein [Actinomycetota bacterium]